MPILLNLALNTPAMSATKFTKLDEIDHILRRPEVYIGRAENAYNKFLDELLTNATDHARRPGSKVSQIAISCDPAAKTIRVMNDGRSMPISRSKEYKVHIPELIFGHLRTSSNYDEDVARTGGGLNGLGAKLVNVFSSKFTVDIIRNNRHYQQVFTDHMRTIGKPVITPLPASAPDRVQVTACIDAKALDTSAKFDLDTMRHRAILAAATAGPDVQIWFNDELLDYNYLSDLVPLEDHTTFYRSKHVQLAVGPRVPGPVIGMVNGVYVPAGLHMDWVLGRIHAKMKAYATKAQVKNAVSIYLFCTVDDPVFGSQEKTELVGPKELSLNIPNRIFTEIATELGPHVKALCATDPNRKLKKRKTMAKSVNVPKYIGAVNPGPGATLILTEGDSALGTARAGLSALSAEARGTFGLFPLRGKMLNVRGASAKKLAANAELVALCKILGLRFNEDHEDTSKLRYGRIIIMTDQDVDGAHIKGLVLNAFGELWPKLATVPGFLVGFRTPLVRASDGTVFYNEHDAAVHRAANPRLQYKYYKGLGTSTAAEAREYFTHLSQNTAVYTQDEAGIEALDLSFNPTRATDRKAWLMAHDPEAHLPPAKRTKVVDFCNQELIHFSANDVHRSIPHVLDGLKPSQRKVLYTCLTRKITRDVRVAQLAASVSELTAYHHGETSLQDCIRRMASDFVGSGNNISLLVPSGNFGSRALGGKDAASARYIQTRLDEITRLVFRPEDDRLLPREKDDDGQDVEPTAYVPCIPMVLVNGAQGIGTGFSTQVPCHNPRDVIQAVRAAIHNKSLPALVPWYKGFTGNVWEKAPGKWHTTGRIEDGAIVELPVGTWTTPYVEAMKKDGRDVYVDPGRDVYIRAPGLTEPPSALTTTTTNMHLIGPDGRVRLYNTAEDILMDWYLARRDLYVQQKAACIEALEMKLLEANNRARFITEILLPSGKLEGLSPAMLKAESYWCGAAGDYKYLLDMPASAGNMARVTGLRTRINQLGQQLDSLRSKSITEIWEEHLDEIEKHLY
jgi:DNA topoisomerase-2